MRNLLAASLAATALTVAVSFSTPVLADASNPTVDDIYQAERAGHLDQAQQMMDQVLREHPTSAKAHYVQAELYGKEGKTALARGELKQAEELNPGLTHENPSSVQELKSQLGLAPAPRATQAAHSREILVPNSAPRAAIPWGMILIVLLVVGGLWMLFRRRNTYAQYPATGGSPIGGPAGTPYGGPGYGPGAPMGGGMGSGIAGGLASGLAVGAGVVAGEELAHHFLDGGRREGALPAADDNDWQQQSSNSDMGGTDFGVNDPGSWDDSSGGGGGGDDWS